ncbi:MAG TPA: hypothetical protein VD838_06810 [Anaeromyxobacteraceae bacterium]|nr:hypothetical protein [Anaeromyxobacteraceae bacterium]
MAGRQVATQERVTTKVVESRADATDPAFHRAILKIALELKKPNARSYEEIVQTTIRSMRLDAAAFRRYLGENGARNMSLMLATARSIVP